MGRDDVKTWTDFVRLGFPVALLLNPLSHSRLQPGL